jgi:putative transposase
MGRLKRKESESGYYHFIQRGVIKKDIFIDNQDKSSYLRQLRLFKERFRIAIYHYCLMTNHVHIILNANDLNDLSKFAYYVGRMYAYYFQNKYKHEGQVFQKQFYSKPILDDVYMLVCGRYIECNPVKAGIVSHPVDYPWSSYLYYAGLELNDLLTVSPAFLSLGFSENERKSIYRQFTSLNNHPHLDIVQT